MSIAVLMPPLSLFRFSGESRYDSLGLLLQLLLHLGLSKKAFLSKAFQVLPILVTPANSLQPGRPVLYRNVYTQRTGSAYHARPSASGLPSRYRSPQIEMLPITPERKAQLDDYARRHGQDTPAALDEALAAHLDWERQDYQDAVEGILEGYADVQAGRTQPAEEVFEELRVKHGLPR